VCIELTTENCGWGQSKLLQCTNDFSVAFTLCQMSTLAVSPFFVENVSEIQLNALKLVTCVSLYSFSFADNLCCVLSHVTLALF